MNGEILTGRLTVKRSCRDVWGHRRICVGFGQHYHHTQLLRARGGDVSAVGTEGLHAPTRESVVRRDAAGMVACITGCLEIYTRAWVLA